jgi:hypothetical protein
LTPQLKSERFGVGGLPASREAIMVSPSLSVNCLALATLMRNGTSIANQRGVEKKMTRSESRISDSYQ